MISIKSLNWIKKQKIKQKIKVKISKISELNKWKYDKYKLFHISKKFFKIVGINIKTNFFKKGWDQPIIKQNEIGILGIVKNIQQNKYLLQAKLEPGNINKLQLSPTLQATKSNYSVVHGGKKVLFLNFFLGKQKYKSIQSEQAFRYYNKHNANIILNTNRKIIYSNQFRWFKKDEIFWLLKKKNLINMDTLSVFSCFIKKRNIDQPINNSQDIKRWISNNDKKYYLTTKIKAISDLKDWKITNKKIFHKNNNFFSIIGLNIISNTREVKKWSQPIIKGKKMSLAGFIMKDFNNTCHYLCRYILKPGSNKSTISCTVNTSDINNYRKLNTLSNFQKKIIKNFFLNKKTKFIYNNILSEEGGRFYHSQINYKATYLSKKKKLKTPNSYIWISQNQMIELIRKRKIDIEARLLFGIINIKETI
tara:strand:- start:3612 stop:4874 length:1263 start_codon:yes stop_codon:yes gene_type:complete